MAISRSPACLLCFVTLLAFPNIQANMNQLSLSLYQILKSEENLCFSPASIGMGLSMVLMGSRNKTAEQIKRLLGYEDEDFIKNLFNNFILRHMDSVVKNTNGVFVDSGLKVFDEYLNGLEYYYKSGISYIDFRTNYELGRKEINNWIHKNTNGIISDLFPPESFSSLTALVLVNTIYFKGLWAKQFDPIETWIGPFTISPTRNVETHMMHVKSEFGYGELSGLGCQVLELPYESSGLSMVIFLPNDKSGLENMEDRLTIEFLNTALKVLTKQKVDVTIPKFKVSNGFSMKEYLIQLGVYNLFGEGCDLSGMSADNLYVSDMFHKSVIEVDEEGTEAAAATGKVISKRSIEMIPEFVADHPFIFLVYDRISDVILFMGKLTQPESVNRKKEL